MEENNNYNCECELDELPHKMKEENRMDSKSESHTMLLTRIFKAGKHT